MKDRKQNGQKDKQRSTKHTHKTKDRTTFAVICINFANLYVLTCNKLQ